MNEKKAKLLRQTVYGKAPQRTRNYQTLETGQVINMPGTLRYIYQGTKKLYKEKNK
jgi:hypothetical protein